jgi:hypothetical protein
MPALVNLPLPEFVRSGRKLCGDLAQAERRAWWLANGHGSCVDGTVAGGLTHRYHGLLIAPVNPPHIPRGAPAQAWSVTCVLEAWWRREQARRTNSTREQSTAGHETLKKTLVVSVISAKAKIRPSHDR